MQLQTNPNDEAPEDEPEEFVEPLPYGVLSRLAHNLYTNPEQLPSYEEKHTVKLPLLAATMDVQASEKIWFLVNAFIDLPNQIVHNSGVQGNPKSRQKKLNSLG